MLRSFIKFNITDLYLQIFKDRWMSRINSQFRTLSSKTSDSRSKSMRPIKPVEPRPEDCCGDGCAFCVYDIYEMQLEEYYSLSQNQDPRPSKPNSEQSLKSTNMEQFELLEKRLNSQKDKP